MSRESRDTHELADADRPRVTSSDLLLALSVAAVGALGALPGSRSGPDPVALLCWLALWSAPAGFLCGASRLDLWPSAFVVPATWMGLLGIADGLSRRDLASPAWAALAWTALFLSGFGLGRLLPDQRLSGTGALLFLAGLLCALPIGAGILSDPFAPALSAHLLDLSPATLLCECAGIDWMRHPAIYVPAGTIDMDPSLRVAFRGSLAGPLAFLVGCSIAVAGDRIARARRITRGRAD